MSERGRVRSSLVLKAPAKLNWFCHVVGRRADGYHLLETAFQFLDFADTLRFEWRDTPGVQRVDQHPYPLPHDDLIIRAARHLATQYGLGRVLPGIRITVTKCIPPGSGMGGGSSNAATTLLGLNAMWGLGLARTQLYGLASKLGADVAVFVRGQSCWATGIGDEFSDWQPPCGWYCIALPAVTVATQQIFQHPDLVRDHPTIPLGARHTATLSNDLEPITRKLFPAVDAALTHLRKYGDARMNGSGGSVYLRCESRAQAARVCATMPREWHALVTRTCNDIRPESCAMRPVA